jgi:hypothetical protein
LDFLGVQKQGGQLISKKRRKYLTDVHVVDLGGDLLDPATLNVSDQQMLGRVYLIENLVDRLLYQKLNRTAPVRK